jgi:hypothetical protein
METPFPRSACHHLVVSHPIESFHRSDNFEPHVGPPSFASFNRAGAFHLAQRSCG